jgi:hypothetical protein
MFKSIIIAALLGLACADTTRELTGRGKFLKKIFERK